MTKALELQFKRACEEAKSKSLESIQELYEILDGILYEKLYEDGIKFENNKYHVDVCVENSRLPLNWQQVPVPTLEQHISNMLSASLIDPDITVEKFSREEGLYISISFKNLRFYVGE